LPAPSSRIALTHCAMGIRHVWGTPGRGKALPLALLVGTLGTWLFHLGRRTALANEQLSQCQRRSAPDLLGGWVLPGRTFGGFLVTSAKPKANQRLPSKSDNFSCERRGCDQAGDPRSPIAQAASRVSPSLMGSRPADCRRAAKAQSGSPHALHRRGRIRCRHHPRTIHTPNKNYSKLLRRRSRDYAPFVFARGNFIQSHHAFPETACITQRHDVAGSLDAENARYKIRQDKAGRCAA
jgi:hypothetical protein